jgi:haloalkane dehalogenase
VDLLRTPDERFERLPDFSFEPHYIETDGLRVHYLDEGPRGKAPILLFHGEPSWCFLYRKMIPPLVAAGHRVLAPDLVGFGRSDKPVKRDDYTYARHVAWMAAWLEALDVRGATLVAQDWGGLIGLRLATEHEARFARVVVANTGLPTGDRSLGPAFEAWRTFSQETDEFPVGKIVAGGCKTRLTPEVIAAYDAPFPDEWHKAGARQFPMLVPNAPDDPAAPANRRAWQVLERWEKPLLTAFSDGDPITKGGEKPFQKLVPGARGRAHVTIEGGGHFLQEDKGPELARAVLDFVASS